MIHEDGSIDMDEHTRYFAQLNMADMSLMEDSDLSGFDVETVGEDLDSTLQSIAEQHR